MKTRIEFVLTPKHPEAVIIEVDTRLQPLPELFRGIAADGFIYGNIWFPPQRIKEAIIEEIK